MEEIVQEAGFAGAGGAEENDLKEVVVVGIGGGWRRTPS